MSQQRYSAEVAMPFSRRHDAQNQKEGKDFTEVKDRYDREKDYIERQKQ